MPNNSKQGPPNISFGSVGAREKKSIEEAQKGNSNPYRFQQTQQQRDAAWDAMVETEPYAEILKAAGGDPNNIPLRSMSSLPSMNGNAPSRKEIIELAAQHERHTENYYKYEAREKAMHGSSQQRGIGKLETTLNTLYSGKGMISAINTQNSDPETQLAGIELSKRMSPFEVHAKEQRIRAAMGAQEEKLREMLPNVSNPEVAKKYEQMRGAYGATVSELTKVGIANKVFDVQGKGIENITTNIAKAQVEKSVEGDKLLVAYNELTTAMKEAKEEVGKLGKVSEETADKVTGAQKKVADASGAMGGGGGLTLGDKMNYAAGMFGSLGVGLQQIGVNQTLGAMQNTVGLASIENQKYDMYKKARGGDVASQMALSEWAGAERVGGEVKFAQNTALIADATAGGLNAAAGAVKTGTAGAELANPGSWITGTGGENAKIAMEGTKEALDGAISAAVALSDVARGISGNAVKIAATSTRTQEVQALNYVSAEQLQGFKDYTTGLGTVARGMGTGGGAFIKAGQNLLTLDKNGKSELEKLGMSPEQVAQMSQYGQDNMGNMFDLNQVKSARLLEKAGVGPKEENMQRMATLTQAGSNNPAGSLGGVLEAAFGKSLENAKTLTALVKNTGDMAFKSVAGLSGRDATAAAATILAANIDPTQTNQGVAIQRARSAAETADQIVTDKTVSFTNMAKISRIQTLTGMSGEDATYAAGLDITTLGDFAREKDPAKQAALLRSQGINATDKNAKTMIANLRKAASISILAMGTVPQSGVNTDELYRKIMSGETLSVEEETQAGKAAKIGHFASREDMMRSMRGVGATNAAGAGQHANDVLAGKGGGKIFSENDKLITDKFSQAAEAAAAAMSKFGGAVGAMKELMRLQEVAHKEGGTAREKEMADAAKNVALLDKAGIKFQDGATIFHDSVVELVKGITGKTPNEPSHPTDNKTVKRGQIDAFPIHGHGRR